ncbi:hypothetical protein J2W80_005662 [Methylorubrum extorquens]|nr:hypothetical protein [Methylorubrum extorquens]MCP1591721.1 hypothetical protein [Methylorubrum extorquens]
MPISNPSMPSVPDGLHVDDLRLDKTGLLIIAGTTAAQASCRVCGRASARVHSRCQRAPKSPQLWAFKIPWPAGSVRIGDQPAV